MIKKHFAYFWVLVMAAVFLTACASNNNNPVEYVVVTATAYAPTSTSTPDPCAPENIKAEVQKVHDHMREFDDASSLAGSIMQGVSKGQMQMSELSNTIPDLQRIRREAEDQPAPTCLANLKTYQISHMYAVLNSLNAFLAGDQQTFDQNIKVARQQHDQYALELARLLGQTVVPVNTAIPASTLPATETPNP